MSGQLSGAARAAPHPEDDRLLLGPLHHLRLRPRRPPGRAGPAARRRRVVVIDSNRMQPRGREGRWASHSSRARRPTTRCCSKAGIERAARGRSPASTPTRRTSSSRSPPGSCAPDILIIARASAEDSEKKLLRAGADRVISPYKTSGSEMARVALHPQVGGAVEVRRLPDGGDRGRRPRATGVGRTVAEVARADGDRRAAAHATAGSSRSPRPQTVIEAGDTLVALGTPDALERLEGLFQPTRGRERAHDGRARARPARGAAGRTARRRRHSPRRRPARAAAAPVLERPKRAGQGDYSTNAAMLLAPVLGAPPREIAERDRRSS